MQAVYDTAESAGLFTEGDIKVRINPFRHFKLGDGKEDFIHISGTIMEGGNESQKANLSNQIIIQLKSMFPDVPIISMNVREFEKATYCNRSMV